MDQWGPNSRGSNLARQRAPPTAKHDTTQQVYGSGIEAWVEISSWHPIYGSRKLPARCHGHNGQFLLLTSGGKDAHAIKVDIHRPCLRTLDTYAEAIVKEAEPDENDARDIRRLVHKNFAKMLGESEESIWRRIRDVWTSQIPHWYSWIPFWRLVRITEVDLLLYSRFENRYEVELDTRDVWMGNAHHLLLCFQNLVKANSRFPLDRNTGNAYCLHGVEKLDQPLPIESGPGKIHQPLRLKGLHMIMGWQMENWELDMVICSGVVITLVTVWRLATKDWSVAAGFGSVAVGLLTIFMMKVNKH